MAPGGELVLETLTIEGDGDMALSPRDRYGKMNNCFFIPTPICLKHWLERCGFSDVRIVSTDRTTMEEQRRTEWIKTESLNDFLDPNDSNKTIEGYPAPERTIVIATR
jgi:tRNA (mo5U34)-methyltransferase